MSACLLKTLKNFKEIRGCTLIFRTGILLHNSKTISPRVKIQAKPQNDRSIALKLGIVHLCTSNTFGDTIKKYENWSFPILVIL